MDFFNRLLTPDSVTMLVLALICLAGYGYSGYKERATGGLWWLLFLISGILAISVWMKIVVL